MEVKAERVNPYDDTRCKTEQVREMFDSIAPAYDFMNRAMTFGLDKMWRRRAVSMIRRSGATQILDVATGTGDLAITLARAIPSCAVTGIDLSEGMVTIGRRKVADAALSDRVRLMTGDCLSLPFDDNTFDCITVAYGVRNFERLLDGYREMYRVLRPGGILCVIELSTPTSPIILPLYRLYTRHVIPAVGRMVSKDVRAYSYLPESIAAVPQGERMLALMAEAGFTHCSHRPLTFGVCTIYTAKR
ncbi:MAG: bifunctional demethylmenaquinone methyltransferase/2-methoxy-6-polyprenyl-1,4-benzoquinol methylase UbiE [Pseudoflavonifractor sp.]|nr:bifunctional demethylmenaquinone methyltransferase/2-methoxy-6-polyprenyl-1,4-benzoquinol methylase UbiE [Pseudoflavonifractor sp.]